MANPLQPKVIKLLEHKYNAYVINNTGTAKAGHPDLTVCLNGLFYGFEIKWKTDRPSELQKIKINKIIDAGGRAYFIQTIEQLCKIIDENIKPKKYELNQKFSL